MRIPLSWLSEYISSLPPVDELARLLTNAGVEVDHIETDSSGETLFDVSLTPNLGHVASVFGVARELAALLGAEVRLPEVRLVEKGPSVDELVRVEVADPVRCKRYACRVVDGVVVGPSPAWLQKRLADSGQRSINNVVDVTNYVLLELGQPLHAFDRQLIADHLLRVDAACPGERFLALDEKERTLSAGHLTIRDSGKPLAIAGVMGGMNSGVRDSTTSIVLESAYFEPAAVAMTSRTLGLSSESSKHFERGCDPRIVRHALDRAAALIVEVAGGTIAKGVIDVASDDFPDKEVSVRFSRVKELLGVQLSMSEVESLLKKLRFSLTWDGKDRFTLSVPPYRHDLVQEIDLIEEVARLYGFENMPKREPLYRTSVIPHSPLYLFEKVLRERLVRQGLQELITCDLISPRAIAKLGSANEAIPVLKATSEEQSVLRTTLLPGLLDVVKYNGDRHGGAVRGFEIGRVYFKTEAGFREEGVVGIVLSGQRLPAAWDATDSDVDFYDLKGIVEELLRGCGIEGALFKKSSFATLHPGRQASVFVDNLEVASFGEVHPSFLREFGVTGRVLFAEMNIKDLASMRSAHHVVQPLPKYPGSERDWTVTLDESCPIGSLIDQVKSAKSPILENVYLKYLYRSDKIGRDKKNATVHFVYRDPVKTVSQDEVEREHERIISETRNTLNI